MTDENFSWDHYYQKIQGRAPRQLLLDALEKFPSPIGLRAIDLGCGDGTETAVLLARGWNVLAVNGEPMAIQRLLEKVLEEARVRLGTQVAKFKDVALSPTDLLYASLSIPFCEPEHFDALWDKIVIAIKPGGWFAGQFFGVRDSWAGGKDMTFHTEEQVRVLLENFEIESFSDATFLPRPLHGRIPIWVVTTRDLENIGPLVRAARCDGIVGGRSPEQLAQMLAIIRSHRTSTDPFDAVIRYDLAEPTPNSAGTIRIWEVAGATWCRCELGVSFETLKEAREFLQAGPPPYQAPS